MKIKLNDYLGKSGEFEISLHYIDGQNSNKAAMEIIFCGNRTVVALDDFKKALQFLEEDLRIFETRSK